MLWRNSPLDAIPEPTAFELNLARLGQELSKHNGPKVAVMGQPGAGKSTLVNNLTDGAAEPKLNIGIHTDATSWSGNGVPVITRFGRYAYIDAPGYDTVEHPVVAFAAGFPFEAVDATVFVVSGKIHRADVEIFDLLLAAGKPLCIARSYADSLDPKEELQVALDVRDKMARSSSRVIFFSNRTRRGISRLREWIRTQVAG